MLQPPVETGDWDEQRLAPPAETGIHAIDAEAKKLHAAAVGAPLSRRGPAPKRRSRYAALAAAKPEPPGSKHAALADFLRGHTDGGTLYAACTRPPRRRINRPRSWLAPTAAGMAS